MLFASARNNNRHEVISDDKTRNMTFWTPSDPTSDSLQAVASDITHCSYFSLSDQIALLTRYSAPSTTMPTYQPTSVNIKSKLSEVDPNMKKLLDLLEGQISRRLPPFSVLTATRKKHPMPFHPLEFDFSSSNIPSSLIPPEKFSSPSAELSCRQDGGYLDEEERTFLDNMCDTMLRCVSDRNWISRVEQEQLKDHVVRVHARWLAGDMTRAHLHGSVATFLCALCPGGRNVDIDIVCRIWDEHDVRKLEKHEEFESDIAKIDQIRNLSIALLPAASNAPHSTAVISNRTPQPSVSKKRDIGLQITPEQIIVGHFCRIAMRLLPRIMIGNPEASRRSEELRQLLRKNWAAWVKKQITRSQLLDTVVNFVHESSPEAEEADVFREFQCWCRSELEKQEKSEHGAVGKSDGDQSRFRRTTRPRSSSTEPVSTSAAQKQNLHHAPSSNCSDIVLTDEEIIVGFYCRHSLLILFHFMNGKGGKLVKAMHLKEIIKCAWMKWSEGETSRSELFDSIAAFVRGACHETEKLDVYQEFKAWYVQEHEKQKQRIGCI